MSTPTLPPVLEKMLSQKTVRELEALSLVSVGVFVLIKPAPVTGRTLPLLPYIGVKFVIFKTGSGKKSTKETSFESPDGISMVRR